MLNLIPEQVLPFDLKSHGNVEARLSGVKIGIYCDWIDNKTVSAFCTAIGKIKSLHAVMKDIKILGD